MGTTLGELAVRFGLELAGDPALEVTGVATLQSAGPGTVSFLANPRYRRYLAGTRAGAVVLDAASAVDCPVPALVGPNPYAAFARIAQVLHPPPPVNAGIHPSAVVHPDADVAPDAAVGPQALVEEGVTIGSRASVGPGCVVMRGASIGPDSRLVARVTLYPGVVLGSRCTVHAGAVIGADGFGFAPDRDGYVKVPQVGGVRIGDDVDIGANTTIDRARFGRTVIGEGTKIDNLVMIAHNVVIGKHCIVCAQVGIAGSAQIGDYVILAGQAGLVGHIRVGDGAIIGANSLVAEDVPPYAIVAGYPARVIRYRFSQETIRKLRELRWWDAPLEDLEQVMDEFMRPLDGKHVR